MPDDGVSEDGAISRTVLADQVRDRLLEAILAGHYPPNSRIVETRVARELGTSQAPVREALRGLEALGRVERHADQPCACVETQSLEVRRHTPGEVVGPNEEAVRQLAKAHQVERARAASQKRGVSPRQVCRLVPSR